LARDECYDKKTAIVSIFQQKVAIKKCRDPPQK
jgi:hypothetical protein